MQDRVILSSGLFNVVAKIRCFCNTHHLINSLDSFMSTILVFIEHKNCVLNKTSLEAITAAQSIAKELRLKVAAVIPCDKDCALAQEIAGYDLEKVIVAKNEKLGTYTPDAYAAAWEQVVNTSKPLFVVMSHTY